MTSCSYAGRHRHRVLRDRVRALALQFEAEGEPMWFDESASEPRSLGPILKSAFERRGLWGAYPKMIDLVHPLARWALRRDASTPVAGAFAVETALDLLAQKSLRGDDAAGAYRNGMPWTPPYLDLITAKTVESPARTPTGYAGDDLRDLRGLPSRIAETLNGKTDPVVQATWSPKAETAGHLYDPVRPPLEALAVAALHAQGRAATITDGFVEISASSLDQQVLGIGLGLSAGPQALSAMLPHAIVYSDAAPYHSAPVELRRWDLVVLNVPRASAVEIAAHLGSGGDGDELSTRKFGELLSRSRRKLDARTDHVSGLVDRLVRQVHLGARVVVLADPEVAPVVEVALLQAGLRKADLLVEPKTLAALYVGAGVPREGSRAPRRHRGLPPTTGRIVTAWETP